MSLKKINIYYNILLLWLRKSRRIFGLYLMDATDSDDANQIYLRVSL